MLKLAAVVFVGAAVGTLAYELVKGKGKNPAMLSNVKQNARNAYRSFVDAFQEGYRGSAD